MNKDYTHIAMIIDRSGSMSTCWNDVLGGYKQLVNTNKDAPGKCTFSVAVFDTRYDVLEDFTDIQAVNEVLVSHPRGGTALLDAIGRTIIEVGKKLENFSEDQRPAKVMVVIQTDGDENSSVEFNRSQIKNMISEQTEMYKWEFQFIGASLESIEEAKSWGIRGSSTAMYSTADSTATFALLGTKMKNSRSASMENYSASIAFTEEDKEVMNFSEKTSKTTK